MKQIRTVEKKRKLELTTNRSTQRRVKSTEGENRHGQGGSEGKTRKATETRSCRIEEREIMSLSPPTKQSNVQT